MPNVITIKYKIGNTQRSEKLQNILECFLEGWSQENHQKNKLYDIVPVIEQLSQFVTKILN